MTDLFRIRFATCNNEVFDNVEIDDIVMYPHNSNNGLFIGGTNSNHIAIKDHITRVTGDLQILGNIFDSNNNTYSLGGDDFYLDSNYILNYHIKDSNVSVNKLESVTGGGDYVVTSYKPLVIRPKIGAGLELVPGEIDNSNILIGNTYIIDKSITTRTINDSAITTTTIADFAVSNEKLGEACISRTKFQDACIFSGAISDNAIISRTIQNNAIITSKIPDQAITKEKIKLKAVTTDRLDTDAVTTIKILDENVTNRKLADYCVTTNKIFESNVTTDKAYRITGTGDTFVLQNNPTITGTANINGDISLFKSTTANDVGQSHGKIIWYSSARDINTNASAEIEAIYGNYEGNSYGYDDTGSIVFRTAVDLNSPIDRMMIKNDGNVGIGTVTPQNKLHVIGDVRVDGDISKVRQLTFKGTPGDGIVQTTPYTGITERQYDADVADTERSELILWKAQEKGGDLGPDRISHIAAEHMWSTYSGGSWMYDDADPYDGTTPAMVIKSDGNVGIGTVTPQNKLHVIGDVRVDGDISKVRQLSFAGVSDDGGTPPHTGLTERLYETGKSELVLWKANDTDGNYGPDRISHIAAAHVWSIYSGGTWMYDDANPYNGTTTAMVIKSDGNVGIGTTDPIGKLSIKKEVAGWNATPVFWAAPNDGNWTANTNYAWIRGDYTHIYRTACENLPGHAAFQIFGLKDASTPLLNLAGTGDLTIARDIIGSGSLFIDGKLGIGTNNPAKKVHIVDNGNRQIIIQNPDTTASAISEIYFDTAAPEVTHGASVGVSQSRGMFLHYNAADRVNIKDTGNIGIGTNNPTAKLHVNGDIKVDGILDFGNSLGDKILLWGANNYKFAISDSTLEYHTDGHHKFFSGQTERMIISPSSVNVNTNLRVSANTIVDGNVGIGYVNPSHKLHVNGNISASTIYGTFNGNGGSISGINGGNITSGTVSSSRLPGLGSLSGKLNTSQISSGDLSVNKLTSTRYANTSFDGAADNLILQNTFGGTKSWTIGVTNTNELAIGNFGNQTARFHSKGLYLTDYSANGSEGGQGLTVHNRHPGGLPWMIGSSWWGTLDFSVYGAKKAYFDNGGKLFSNGTEQTSDDRVKSDEVFITNALATVNKIRPQEYIKWSTIDYANDSNAISMKESGIIAQELYINAPELRHLITLPRGSDSNIIALTASNYASYSDLQNDPIWPEWSGGSNSSSSIASVNYIGLIPYTIQAIRELHHIVCDLQKENKELRDIIYSSLNA